MKDNAKIRVLDWLLAHYLHRLPCFIKMIWSYFRGPLNIKDHISIYSLHIQTNNKQHTRIKLTTPVKQLLSSPYHIQNDAIRY